MAIIVFHNSQYVAYKRHGTSSLHPENWMPVAVVLTPVDPHGTKDLDIAFRKTNHVEQNWAWHEGVVPLVQSRSTSVGDLLLRHTGEIYVVELIGFKRLDNLPAVYPVERHVEMQETIEANVRSGNSQEEIYAALTKFLSREGCVSTRILCDLALEAEEIDDE